MKLTCRTCIPHYVPNTRECRDAFLIQFSAGNLAPMGALSITRSSCTRSGKSHHWHSVEKTEYITSVYSTKGERWLFGAGAPCDGQCSHWHRYPALNRMGKDKKYPDKKYFYPDICPIKTKKKAFTSSCLSVINNAFAENCITSLIISSYS